MLHVEIFIYSTSSYLAIYIQFLFHISGGESFIIIIAVVKITFLMKKKITIAEFMSIMWVYKEMIFHKCHINLLIAKTKHDIVCS
jgi:hypothetical protein